MSLCMLRSIGELATVSLKQRSVDRRITDHSSTTVVLPQLHQETVVLKRYMNHSLCHIVSTLVLATWSGSEGFQRVLVVVGVPVLGEVTRMKDGRSKNLTRTRNVPPKCNKQVTSKQQTRSFLTSIN
jgi:hypothetical protein